ncbi:MAG: Uma2 family endonuclease [Pirellula sp.]
MSSVDRLIEPLRHSPQLPQAIAILQLEAERKRREQFYHDMTPDQKIEFIEGEVVLHSPARNRHLDVTGKVFQLLNIFVALHGIGQVKSEKCLCVFPRNDYEPDVVFFGLDKSASLTPDTMKFPVPDLAIEVLSQSTEDRDRGVKFEDFSSNGVAEYWIIDADELIVEQYLLNNGEYRLALKSGSGTLKSQVILGFAISIEAIFDEKENLQAIRKLLD